MGLTASALVLHDGGPGAWGTVTLVAPSLHAGLGAVQGVSTLDARPVLERMLLAPLWVADAIAGMRQGPGAGSSVGLPMPTAATRRIMDRRGTSARARQRAGGPGTTGQAKKPCRSWTCKAFEVWWRFRDSNPGPADYDSVALTG